MHESSVIFILWIRGRQNRICGIPHAGFFSKNFCGLVRTDLSRKSKKCGITDAGFCGINPRGSLPRADLYYEYFIKEIKCYKNHIFTYFAKMVIFLVIFWHFIENFPVFPFLTVNLKFFQLFGILNFIVLSRYDFLD